jgi:hypothetical protein
VSELNSGFFLGQLQLGRGSLLGLIGLVQLSDGLAQLVLQVRQFQLKFQVGFAKVLDNSGIDGLRDKKSNEKLKIKL